MKDRTNNRLRTLAVLTAIMTALFLTALGTATMALANQANGAPLSGYRAPLDDGTPEATETHEVEPTETHVEGTETPEATGTQQPRATETHEVEPTETGHPEMTETPEGTETPEVTETPTAQVTPHSSDTVPGAGARLFPQTGKTVQGLFLQYWDRNGGLMQQGLPISSAAKGVSALNGRTYTMQYFERSAFEYHPENQAPFNVLLAQLGTFQYRSKYPSGAPNQVANKVSARYFPETNHWVGGKFWQYWQSHGGLMQQGYPISDEFVEKSALDGKSYTVQYFERAVFEYHPENQAPFDVLLSQLGTFLYKQQGGK